MNENLCLFQTENKQGKVLHICSVSTCIGSLSVWHRFKVCKDLYSLKLEHSAYTSYFVGKLRSFPLCLLCSLCPPVRTSGDQSATGFFSLYSTCLAGFGTCVQAGGAQVRNFDDTNCLGFCFDRALTKWADVTSFEEKTV